MTIALWLLIASTASAGSSEVPVSEVPVSESEEVASAIEAVADRCAAYARREGGLDVQSLVRLQPGLAGDKFLAWKDINAKSRYLLCITEVLAQISDWVYEEDRDGAETLVRAGELYASGEVPESFDLIARRVSEHSVAVDGREISLAEFRGLIRARSPASVLVAGEHPDQGFCIALLGLVTGARVFATHEPDGKPFEVSYRADQGVGSKEVAFTVNSVSEGRYDAQTKGAGFALTLCTFTESPLNPQYAASG